MPAENVTKRQGFTLIELLVVIVLIALLMAILAVALAKSKESARRLVCSNTIKQFIVGALVYANEYKQNLPSGQSEQGSDEHTPVITRKMGDTLVKILGSHAALKCPWLRKPFDGRDGWYYPGYGYVLGYHYLGGHSQTPWHPTSAGNWKSPQTSSDNGQLILIAELNAWSSDARTFAPHGMWGPINKYHQPGTGGMTPQKAGAAGGNIGQLDGSVYWKTINNMTTHPGSHMDGCYAVW